MSTAWCTQLFTLPQQPPSRSWMKLPSSNAQPIYLCAQATQCQTWKMQCQPSNPAINNSIVHFRGICFYIQTLAWGQSKDKNTFNQTTCILYQYFFQTVPFLGQSSPTLFLTLIAKCESVIVGVRLSVPPAIKMSGLVQKLNVGLIF